MNIVQPSTPQVVLERGLRQEGNIASTTHLRGMVQDSIRWETLCRGGQWEGPPHKRSLEATVCWGGFWLSPRSCFNQKTSHRDKYGHSIRGDRKIRFCWGSTAEASNSHRASFRKPLLACKYISFQLGLLSASMLCRTVVEN